MPWFKVDDAFATHMKAQAAGNAALGLWVRAGSWCAQQLTDGLVPAATVAMLGGRPADARALVDAGLWHPVAEGFQFHDWEEFQPTREHVLSERRAATERQRRARDKARESRGKSQRESRRDTGVSHDEVQAVSRSPRPDPTSTTPNGVAHTTQTLIAEWLDHSDPKPPQRVIGQLSREIKNLLEEGYPYDTVRAAVMAWTRKVLHPSALASVLHEVQSPPAQRRTTTSDLVAGTLALADRLDNTQEAS